MEQSRKAAQFVLRNLNEGDLFNVVVYDDRVETFRDELQLSTKKNLEDAEKFINGIMANGGTNIYSSLQQGMGLLKKSDRPSYMIFMTDGLPTAGITEEIKIAENTLAKNEADTRLFVFGVGEDVNARLLDRLSSGNKGSSVYVRPGEDIESAVAQMYRQISSPVLTDIQIDFAENDLDDFFDLKKKVSQTYPEQVPDLFRGGQILWSGRYTSEGKAVVIIKGKSEGKELTFRFPVEFHGSDQRGDQSYVEKVWASRRVGYLINQIDLNGKSQELVDELVNLSKKYGILTPYTAFLVREDVDVRDLSQVQGRAQQELDQLDEVRGSNANAQRTYKANMSKNARAEISLEESGMEAYVEKKDLAQMQNVGNKTFYNRNGEWVDGDLTKEDEKKVVKVQKFSKEYFDLTKGQTAEFNQVASMNGNVKVKYNNVVYYFSEK